MQEIKKGLSALHIGSLLLGGTALFSKLLETSALEITLWRSFIAGAALLTLLLISGTRIRLRCYRDYGVILLLGAILALHWVTYFHSMQVSTVAIGIIAFFSHPIITVLLEPLLARKRPRPIDLALALWVFCGITIMVIKVDPSIDLIQGVSWGIFSALLFSIRNILYKQHFSHYNSTLAMMYQCVIVGLVLLPFAGSFIVNAIASEWILLIILGVIFTATPHTLFSYSLRLLPVKTASLIMCLVPLYAATLAALLLSEMPDMNTIVGGTMVLSAAIYESIQANPTKTRAIK